MHPFPDAVATAVVAHTWAAAVLPVALNGMMTNEVLFAAGAVPLAIFLGGWLGTRISKWVNENLFHKISLLLLAAFGLPTLAGGLLHCKGAFLCINSNTATK